MLEDESGAPGAETEPDSLPTADVAAPESATGAADDEAP